LIVIFCFSNGYTQEDALSHESSEMLEVFLSSRVSLTDKLPLHYTGIENSDSASSRVLDTLDRVLTRDLTISGHFNLRLPNLPPDTSFSNPFAARTTYLDGDFNTDSSFQATLHLRMPYGANAFWGKTYRFEADKARAAAHRIAADVILQLTGEPTVMQTRIAYLGKMGGGKEIFSATFDGFDHQRHTGQGVPILSPSWSPDGQRVAYTSFLNDEADIFILNLEDGGYEPFVANPGVDQSASWSPDGQWIAYSSSVNGNPEIYIKEVETGRIKRLTYSWAIEISPSWSPTGHEIAFVSDQLSLPQVFIMDADGSNQRRLTTEGNYNASPVWSPRGDLIAYVRRDVDGFQIYITDPQGEKHVKLTTGPGQNTDPCWSPDGLKLAFTSNRTGRKQIYTMDLFGRHLTRISDRSLSCSSPTWSPILLENDEISVTSQITEN
jgi:TolB protein